MDRVFRLLRYSCNSVCRDRRIANFAPIDISWVSRVIDGLGALKDKLTPLTIGIRPLVDFLSR